MPACLRIEDGWKIEDGRSHGCGFALAILHSLPSILFGKKRNSRKMCGLRYTSQLSTKNSLSRRSRTKADQLTCGIPLGADAKWVTRFFNATRNTPCRAEAQRRREHGPIYAKCHHHLDQSKKTQHAPRFRFLVASKSDEDGPRFPLFALPNLAYFSCA